MRPLAAKLLGVVLLSSVGGCCFRPVSGYYAYDGPAVCHDVAVVSYGSSHHRSAAYAPAPCRPSGVATYRSNSPGHHSAPSPSPRTSGSQGGGHSGNGGSHHQGSPSPGSPSQGSHGGHR